MGHLTDAEWDGLHSAADIMADRVEQHEEALEQRRRFGLAEDSCEPWLILNIQGYGEVGKFPAGDGNGQRIKDQAKEWFASQQFPLDQMVRYHVDVVQPLLGRSELTEGLNERFVVEDEGLAFSMECTGFGDYHYLLSVQAVIDIMGQVYDGDDPVISFAKLDLIRE